MRLWASPWSRPPEWFAFAAAFFSVAYAVIISRGIRSCPMLKCSSERCVWAPQSLSAGTSTSPRLSNSLRTAVMASSDVVQMKDFGGLRAHPPGQRGVVDQRFAVRGDHRLQLGRPAASLQLVLEASLDDLDHDPDRRRCAWRRSQERNQRSGGGAHYLCSEREDAHVPQIASACDASLVALLGASPGASTAVWIM